ncbi:hypothetical protein Dsin_029656 [Dipteronia sinensis]|uniref:26S proteasome regulatory subunit Rpn7 N-terminal domain-containing protein n=1 Tax=Dipteronia sinensis TaxID=43782 RepID=A0AAD9ZSY5_9ROSI|nr:hypothetical protein Dsin_029656 [Dipteronia sinensis]
MRIKDPNTLYWLTFCFTLARIADAAENLVESEVREAHLAKSLFYIQIGDKDKALKQLKLGFMYMDFDLISKSIDKAIGGDWIST